METHILSVSQSVIILLFAAALGIVLGYFFMKLFNHTNTEDGTNTYNTSTAVTASTNPKAVTTTTAAIPTTTGPKIPTNSNVNGNTLTGRRAFVL